MNELAYLALDLLVPALFLAERWGGRLDAIAHHVLGWKHLAARAAFVLSVYMLTYWAAYLPIRAVLELFPRQVAGLSHESARDWLLGNLPQFGWAFLFVVLPGVTAIVALRRWPRGWWWRTALVYALGACVVALTSLAGWDLSTLKRAPLADKALLGSIEELAARAGVPAPLVIVTESSARGTDANAYAGDVFGRPLIDLDDTTIALLEPAELLQVAAHELGHFVHRHGWRRLAREIATATVILWLTSLVAPALLRRFGARWRIERLAHPAAIPLLLMVTSAMEVAVTPAALALSREEERAADRFARRLLPAPEACVASFVKLGYDERRGIDALLSTHPPTSERLAICREPL